MRPKLGHITTTDILEKRAQLRPLSRHCLVYHDSDGQSRSRPDQCAHWSARGDCVSNRPALTGAVRQNTIPVGNDDYKLLSIKSYACCTSAMARLTSASVIPFWALAR